MTARQDWAIADSAAQLQRCPNCWRASTRERRRCEQCGYPFRKSQETDMSEPNEPLVQFATGATRSADAENFRYDLISPHGHRRLAARYALGAKAHGARNWEGGMPAGDVMNHLERHLNLWKAGDRSEDHLAAVAWGIYAIMHYETTLPELVVKDFPEKT